MLAPVTRLRDLLDKVEHAERLLRGLAETTAGDTSEIEQTLHLATGIADDLFNFIRDVTPIEPSATSTIIRLTSSRKKGYQHD
jgi:hypothetical protein